MTTTADPVQSSATPGDAAQADERGERRFDLDELFFSRTDRKGIILSGNQVFVRVSGYSLDRLVGAPHNIIRHPDMPRAVFQTLWDQLHAGNSVTAYVKNRAADGRHYWVLATVDGAGDDYVSVRMKPTSELFAAVQGVYADVLAVEQKVEDGDVRRRKASIQAGMDRLQEILDSLGFADYPAFVRALLPTEVSSREALLSTSVVERLGTPPHGADPRLATVLSTCASTYELLDGVGADLARAVNDTLAPKYAYVHELAEDIRLFSLNALLSATRLGSRGAALGAVAELMRARSQTAGPITDALGTDIAGAVELLGGMGYRVAIGKLQLEMMMVFLREMIERGDCGCEGTTDLCALGSGVKAGVRGLCSSLSDLDDRLDGLAHHARRLLGELGVLGSLQINGRIEASRLNDAEAVLALFETIGGQVAAAHGHLADFDTIHREYAVGDDAVRRRMLAGLEVLDENVSSVCETRTACGPAAPEAPRPAMTAASLEAAVRASLSAAASDAAA